MTLRNLTFVVGRLTLQKLCEVPVSVRLVLQI